jgi:hypothetical protein
VYGFLDNLGKGPAGNLDKVTPQMVLDNPEKYGAEIIGQGLHFKKTDSKKLAAEQALNYLSRQGIKKG